MPHTTERQNYINPLTVVEDAASEALNQPSVWLQHVVRTSMPSEAATKEVPKKGTLGRLVLPENTEYTFGAYSELLEDSTLLNAIKSTVISRVTKESEKFNRRDPFSEIGFAQGEALRIGWEEDVASLAAGYSSSVTSDPSGATQLDLHSCALDIRMSTNGMHGQIVAVVSNKTAYELGPVQQLDPTKGAVDYFANPAGSSTVLTEAGARPGLPAGFIANLAGIDVYQTNIIDDDGTNYRNLVFDSSRALIGMWDDAAQTFEESDVVFFRDLIASCAFADFAMHWDEAACQLLSPIL